MIEVSLVKIAGIAIASIGGGWFIASFRKILIDLITISIFVPVLLAMITASIMGSYPEGKEAANMPYEFAWSIGVLVGWSIGKFFNR